MSAPLVNRYGRLPKLTPDADMVIIAVMLGARQERASVLVVEDDESVANTLRSVLAEDRYGVRVAGSLFQARGLLARALPDLVILDRGLPDGDGLELCRALRSDPRTQRIPILFLSARKEVADRVVGLEEGADDYLAKPFSPAELLARAKAVLRRTMNKPAEPGLLSIGPLRIAPEAHQVFLFDRELLLRPKEYNLLMAFLESRGRVLSRRALLQSAWGLDKELELETNVVDVTVGSLRRKLGAYGRCIVSVHSVGFRFDADRLPVPPAPPNAADLGTDPKKRRR